MTTQTPSERRIAFLGGRASGKTTYMARLWLQIDEAGPSAPLRRRGMLNSYAAVNALAQPLLSGRYPDRTTSQQENALQVPLILHSAQKEEPFTLLIPDYDGEDVKKLYETRGLAWTAEWERQKDATGLALFVRPDGAFLRELPVLHPPRIQDDSPQAEFDTPRIGGHQNPQRNPRPSDEVKIPTALNLIELLQFLRQARGLHIGECPPAGSLRIAVIFSCWDQVIREKGEDYSLWNLLHGRLALLEDFLYSNFGESDWRLFGLSATGRNLKDSPANDGYIAEESGFVILQDRSDSPIVKHSEIELPLLWLLEGDAALDRFKGSRA